MAVRDLVSNIDMVSPAACCVMAAHTTLVETSEVISKLQSALMFDPEEDKEQRCPDSACLGDMFSYICFPHSIKVRNSCTNVRDTIH